MLDVLYEEFGKRYQADGAYAIYFFYGSYDVPLKASDKESLWESEEVYQFIICAVCIRCSYQSPCLSLNLRYLSRRRKFAIEKSLIFQSNHCSNPSQFGNFPAA